MNRGPATGWTLLLGAALLGGGCATDQRRDVDAYRAIGDPPGAVPVHVAGAPLSLLEALRLAAAHNEQIGVRGEEYVQALADRQRLAAALKPTFDVFAATTLRENTGTNSVAESGLGFSGQYRLLTGQGDLRAIDAADATVRSREWLILDLRESLLLQTARAYYEVLRAERLSTVLESSVQTQLARLDDARARGDVGFARPLDVAQIEAQVSRTRVQLITAQRLAREARATLALLTNAPVAGSLLTDGFEPPIEDWDAAELGVLARRHRQDLLSARNEAEAARQLVDEAISQYAPTLSINLDYFLVRAPDDSASAVASLISLRVPVFSAGRIEADVREAWSVFRQRVLEYRLRAREAERDVETALVQVRASRALAEELRTQVLVARQALALAEASYEAGLGTNLERVTAQDELLSAELEAASEEFVTKFATLALRRACGLLSGEMMGSVLPEVRPEELAPPDAPLLDRPAP